MFLNNSTEFSTVDNIVPIELRIFLVVSACAASIIGNLFIIIIFTASVRENKSRVNSRCRVIDIIIVSLAITALFRGLLLGPVQAACFSAGDWSLGESICQLQAFLEAMLRNAYIWYLGLLSVERYTKHITPHNYLVTFSPLTVNIILPGILLIVVVQVTGPLYGWGKYDYIQGSGLCGAATISTFGCSYAVYLLLCLTIPPVLVITVNGFLLASRLYKNRTTETPKRNVRSGNSRILTAGNELSSLVVFMSLFVVLSTPRSITEVTMMCNGIDNINSQYVFTLYFMDSLTNPLLPIICITVHPSSRKLFCDIFKKHEPSNIAENIDMTSVNSQ